MVKNKKVLILNIPPPYGGGEIRASLLRDYFKDSSDYVIVTNTNKNKNKANQGKLSLANIFLNLLYIKKNCLMVWQVKPKVVYTSIPKDIFPLLKILPLIFTVKSRKAKLVGELAGRSFYFLEKKGLRFWIGLKILKKFDSIRVLGETVQQHLLNHNLNNLVVIDNGIRPPKYQAKKRVTFLPKAKTIHLLFIGALNENKGIHIIIDIVKLMAERKITFHFDIVGEWSSEYDKIRALKNVRDNNLKNYVSFHGLTRGAKKIKLLQKADLFVFPSYNEGQPLVLIESMAYGIPIVSSNVGAIPDTMENEINGFLIENHRAQDYLDKIILLIENPDLLSKISQANLVKFQERFTSDRYCLNIRNWIEHQAV